MMTFDSRNQHNQQDGEERSAEQRKYRIFALLFALAAFSLVFSSCMSVPRDVAVSGLFDHFERTPQVLARAESAFLRDMAASFDDSTIQALISMTSENPDNGQKPINRDRLDKTLARAEAAGIGISWNSRRVRASKQYLQAISQAFLHRFHSASMATGKGLREDMPRSPGSCMSATHTPANCISLHGHRSSRTIRYLQLPR